jgi:hypothetical protein
MILVEFYLDLSFRDEWFVELEKNERCKGGRAI